MSRSSTPFDATVLRQAAALASVGPNRFPELLGQVDAQLTGQREALRRQYERVHADDERELFLVAEEFWPELGAELGFDDREWKAVRRAHETQLERVGSQVARHEEFETALEIRSVAVVSRD